MKMRAILGVIAMTAIWMILAEGFDWITIVWGVLAGSVTMFFCHKFMPEIPSGKNVNKARLIFYPFYLIFQIYKGAVGMVKFVITGAKFAMVVHEPVLKCEPLRVMLADSITLVPGSATISFGNGEKLLCLFAYPKNVELAKKSREEIEDMLVGSIEKTLLKAERKS